MAVRGIGQPDDSPISKSAMLVVTACAVVSKEPAYARTFNDPYAAWFASAISQEAAARLPTLDDPTLRAAFIKETERGLDGLVTHVVYRKPWITDRVQEGLRAGVEQLVILGAGCDTLSLRLAQPLAQAQVFELDREPVIDFRRRVLQEHSALADNVQLLGVDLSYQDPGAVLKARGFDQNRPAIIIAEGVIEYLTGDAVERLFAFAREMGAQSSRLIFTFLATKVYEQGDIDALRNELHEGGETLKFGLVPERIDQFLNARGFRILEMATPDKIKQKIVPLVAAPVGVIPGWHLVSAERE
jgi:methyltransferase (TIGR00027 family)